jgi:hypothetical protein
MKRSILLLAGACGAVPPPSPPSNAASGPAVVALAPVDPAWQLKGSARVERGELQMSYCCVAWGSATRPLALGPGRWKLAVTHANTECTEAAHAVVFAGDGMLLASEPLAAGPGGGVTTVAFEATAAGTGRLVIAGDGGLHCCGTTAIRSIVVEPR